MDAGLFSELGCARTFGADAAVSACESTALAPINEDAALLLAMECDADVDGFSVFGVIGLAAESIRSPLVTCATGRGERSRELSAAARSRVPSASARSRTPATDAAIAPIESAAVSGSSSRSAEDAHLAYWRGTHTWRGTHA